MSFQGSDGSDQHGAEEDPRELCQGIDEGDAHQSSNLPQGKFSTSILQHITYNN